LPSSCSGPELQISSEPTRTAYIPWSATATLTGDVDQRRDAVAHRAGFHRRPAREEGFFQLSGLTSIDDIAEAAGVSPRTYNYFSSREQASVAAVTAERDARVAASVAARPVSVPLADAVTEAIAELAPVILPDVWAIVGVCRIDMPVIWVIT
jgi:hypothetical protein